MSWPLHDFHYRLSAQFGEIGSRETVLSYGDVEAEYRAARSACGLFDASSRDLLALTGSDRASFLHGMVSNDVKGLPEGRCCYAALLTAKGKMVADARVLALKEELLLDLEPGLGQAAAQHLSKHLISEDAELHDAGGRFCLFHLLGPRTEELLGSLDLPTPADFSLAESQLGGTKMLLAGNKIGSLPGVDLFVPREGSETVLGLLLDRGRSAGLRPIGFSAMEVLRVEAGLPRFGPDMDEHTHPLEAGLERAISFTKGCYVGQEVVARTAHRGHVNHRLAGIIVEGERPLVAGAELFPESSLPGGERIGQVTSSLYSPTLRATIALAYLRREQLEPDTQLVTREGIKARVASLPFVP